MKENRLITDFTVGSIPKMLIRFMLPFMASNALQVIYSLVDMVVVGQFVGSAGISAVSQGSAIVLFAGMIGMGFSQSGQVMISQLIGAGRREDIKKVNGTLFTIIILLSAVMTVLLIALRSQLVDLLKVPVEARDMAIDYVLVTGAATIFTCGYNAVSCILRGMGDSKDPFKFILVSSLVNIALDLLFTGVFQWSVFGAALATAISQAVSLILSLILLVRKKDEFYFDFKLESFKMDKEYTARMVRLGVPLALQLSAISLTMMVVNMFVNTLGVTASATYGAGLKIDDIVNKVSMAIQYAAAPMVGQNLGAGKNKRVNEILYWTWGMSAVMYAIFTTIYLIWGREVFAMFTSDADVLDLCPVFVANIVWSFPAMTIMRGSNALLQGRGESVLIMLFAFIDAGLRVILSYLLGIVLGLGFVGFVLGFALSPYGVSVPGLIYFLAGKWKTKKLAIN